MQFGGSNFSLYGCQISLQVERAPKIKMDTREMSPLSGWFVSAPGTRFAAGEKKGGRKRTRRKNPQNPSQERSHIGDVVGISAFKSVSEALFSD